ncbi:hypothetical protein C4559_06425 [Candidatus Microgenomates bacterium]|nr:MAG: hypothetical protein C4559_06425 [Candidatus Microgenomates bacterium]
MAKKEHNKLQTKWIILFGIALMLIIGFGLFKNNAKNGSISKEEAVAKVKALPDVINYFKRVPNGQVSVNGEEDNSYLIQVYEVKNDHTATFNWYNIDKATGEVQKEF